MDEEQPASECPSCGRFVGPYARCPYCGADVGQRMAVRAFRYGSLVLAILGVAVLLLVAVRSQAPRVEIEDLVGTMNWANIRIEGVVTRQPAYDPENGSLKFWVWDETGEIMAVAYRSEAQELLAGGLVPVMGDHVVLEGTLRVRDDFRYLILDVPQHTEILAPEAVAVAISQVDTGRLYDRVTVRGVIRGDRVPYEGLRILSLRDATGEIDVTLPTGTLALGGEMPELGVGQTVQVTGAVDQYRGRPQISVGRAGDLVALDEALEIAPLRRIRELSAGDEGGMAAIEGEIVRANPFSAGVKLALEDGSGRLTLLLWQDLYESLADREALDAGAVVRVQGLVTQYQGELEIVPQLPSDLSVLAVAQDAVARRPLGELSAGDVDRVVEVEGVLLSLRAFSAGVKGVLDDGTGQVTLLLWQDLYDALPDPALLVPGARVQVEGAVSEYRGELEVVPQSPAGVAVVGREELPSQERAIGQITGDDVGQTVEVAGQIAEETSFSKGMWYTLDDGTGTITLLLWENLREQLADPGLLAVGAQVSVRGVVDEYRGDLEVVPQVPADLQVIAPAEVAMAGPTATAAVMPGTNAVPAETPSPASENAGPAATATPGPPTAAATAPAPPPTPSPTPAPYFETREIGAITSGDVGRIFTIASAGIAELDYFSKGVKYDLTDGTGSITLLVWQNVLEGIPDRYAVWPGSRVKVSGEIATYQGDLEIIPRQGSDLVVLARGERLPIEERAAGEITPSDEGRIFTVEGEVARTESSDWLKLWLNDGTGEILVFVPERTVPYLPPGAGMGARLRVRGEVDIYQGTLEIIPLAGADVEVR